MADKTISVSLDFTANTNQAETALKSLQSSLQNISNMSTIGQDARMAKNIEEASAAAMTLRNNLQAAFDQKTGSLNLSKLNEEMAKSGMSAEKYRTTLSAIGPQGRQAFMELANAVVASETPLRQTTGLVDKLWDSLKRTAGWQLSSSMIHGFMGAVQSAYGYAQNLNKSLNNIRIVTGYSTDEMAKFAEQANKAAKGLSATTTDYTDAALIYYQQGIRDQSEIEGRVATTIKLANVSGQSAEEVSSQMTAIWNNFDDGSKSLEYYADVITALGAATASSSQEISQGLSKFAAVAETVGMSYEYATSALATIVATTRQSADTVGTGLRTLFSRLQGLKLGETLEDGVDLNKYSQALDAVGVKALDASGELRNMDEILDDLGERWGDLSQAQKVALAQTVGGVRQYTNLVALMDNWDFMKENVGIAEGAEGTLQEQADIYAESWEAAGKRVRAAAESIYSDLLKDDFFIDITKLFAGFLETIDRIIDAFGGLGGTLPLILTLMNKIFGEKMQAGAQRIAENIYYSTSKGKQERIQKDAETKQAFINEAQKTAQIGTSRQEGSAMATGYQQIAKLQMEMVQNADRLSQTEKQTYEMEIQRLTALTKQTAELGKQADQAEKIRHEDSINIRAGAEMPHGTQEAQLFTASRDLLEQDYGGLTGQNSLQSAAQISDARFFEELIGLQEGTIQTTQQLSDAFHELDSVLSGNFEDDLSRFEQFNVEIGNMQALLTNIKNSASTFEFIDNNDTAQMNEAKTQLQEFRQSITELYQNTGRALPTEFINMEQQINEGRDLVDVYDALGRALENFIAIQRNSSSRQANILQNSYGANGLTEYNEEIQEATRLNQIFGESFNHFRQDVQPTKSTLDQVRESLAATGGVAVTTSEKISMSIGALTNFGQAAMNISMAFSSVKGLADAITAPDMSGWERFTSVLMSLGMLIPSIIAVFNNLSTAMTTLIETTSIIEGFKKVASGMDLATASAIRKTIVDTTLTDAEKATAIATKLVATGMEKEKAEIVAVEIAETGAIGPTLGLGGAFKILATAVWAAIKPFLPLVLVITALVAAFQLLKINSPEAQLERQKQTTEDLANAYTHANEEAKELSDTLSKFKSNENALKNLTKGSEEFSEKLKENNELMLKLIDAADLIAGEDFYIDSNGVYHLTKTGEGKVETAQNDLDQQAAQISAAQRMSQAVQAKKQNIADMQEVTGAGIGIGGGAGQTFQEVDTAMRKQGQNNLEGFEAFNKLVKDIWDQNEENIYTLKDLQDYIQRSEGTDKQVSAQAKKYVSDLANSSLNQQTKNLIASGGFIGEEEYFKNTHEANSSVVNSSAKADSDVALAVAQFDKRVAASLNLAADGLTEGVSGAIDPFIEETKKKLDQKTDKDIQEEYAKLMGKTVEELEDEDIDISQMRETLAMYLAAGMPEVAEQILTTIKENLANSGFLDNAMQSAGINVREDQKGAFQEAALQVTDWSSEEQLQAFQETLSQLGMNIPLEQLKAFADALLQVGDAASTSNSLVEGQDKVDQAQAHYESEVSTFKGGESEEERAARISAAAQELARAKDELDATLDSTLESEAGKYGLDGEYLKELGDAYQEKNEKLAEEEGMLKATAEAAKDAAVRYARLNEAVEDIAKNYDNYIDVLNDAKKVETAEAKAALKNTDNFKKLQKSVAGLLDVSEELVDVDLIKAIDPKDFEKAAKGDEKAIERIRNTFIDLQAAAAGLADDPSLDDFKEKINSLSEGAIIDIDNDPFLQKIIQSKFAAHEGATEIGDALSGFNIDTDGIYEFTEAVDDATYQALLAAQGNSAEMGRILAENTSLEVADDEQIILDNDPSDFVSAIPEPMSIKMAYSIPQFTDTGTAGYKEGPPAKGMLVFPGFRTKTESVPTNEKKTHTIHGIKVKNGHKSYGGIAPSTSTKKSGGGGGGGGGGGSRKSKDAPTADRSVRYHNITQRQSNVSRNQDENNRRKDRAFGKTQVELAREDLEIQKKKIELQEEYVKEISTNLKKDRNEMQKFFGKNGLNIPIKFDEDGEIDNYQDVMDALLEKEKALVAQYNSGGLDDEAFDKAKKKLDEAKEALGNYEETLELQKDELQTLAEYMEELSDKALEITKIKFELNMSIIEDQLEWLDYSLSKLENDAYGAAKAFSLLGTQTQKLLDKSNQAQVTIEEILQRHGINSIAEIAGLTNEQIAALGFNKDEIDMLRDLISELYDTNNALLEIRETMVDKVFDTFDKFNEKVEESYEQFNHYGSVLENLANIVDLLDVNLDDKSRELISNIRQAQLKNAETQALSAKKIYEDSKIQQAMAEENYKRIVAQYGLYSIQAQEAEESLTKMQEIVNNAKEEWLDSVTTSLEQVHEIYEAEMEQLQRDTEKALAGAYGTLDYLNDAYENTQKLRENYIPEYEKIYELNKLNRDIQKEIDNSSSVRDRKALRQLQEEINRKQEAGVELSKYEVEEMRKKFELEQARMNLEDARNNKSEVRLTRDQNGNWGYVYTASEDKVADAEQKYEDALYNYQKLSQDYINDLSDQLKDVISDFHNSFFDILNDETLTEDEKKARIQDLIDRTNKFLSFYKDQMGISTSFLNGSLGLTTQLYGQAIELVDSLAETDLGKILGIENVDDIIETLKTIYGGTKKEWDGIVTKRDDELKKISDAHKLDEKGIQKEVDEVNIGIETTATKTENRVNELTAMFGNVIGELEKWDTAYGNTLQSAIGSNENFITSLTSLIGALASISSYEFGEEYELLAKIEDKVSKGEDPSELYTQLGQKITTRQSQYSKESSKLQPGEIDTKNQIGSQEGASVLSVISVGQSSQATILSNINDYLENSNIDTTLSQIDINIKSVLTQIDTIAQVMGNTNLNSNNLNNYPNMNESNYIEQQVHIDASFPNVQNHTEIEEAFENLVNKASQYANRKNMSSQTFQDSYISTV